MLKFITEYLKNRKQRVVVGGTTSTELDVISGVPQGSILGPLLFVLFINDMHEQVSPNTNIALYADDTKIWRAIKSEEDCLQLQQDINSLIEWARINCMKFHPKKCKILTLSHKYKTPFSHLPFATFQYTMSDVVLDYTDTQKDLGILINNKFKWNDHCASILAQAINKFNLMRRTCHFVKNKSKKRMLYLTLVRSLFEHGSVIWAPQFVTIVDKFESLQKKCIKWIRNEQFTSYSTAEYIYALKDLDILPMQQKFIYTDIVTFHKIVHKMIPVAMPDTIINNSSRTRSTANDDLSFMVNPNVRINKAALRNDFFLRCVSFWNWLPHEIRSVTNNKSFAKSVKTILWDLVLVSVDGSMLTQMQQTDNDLEPD